MQQDERHQPRNGTAWVNSDIVGTQLPESVRLQDDFHTAVNLEWLRTAEIEPGNSSESSFWERMREVEAQVKEMLADPALGSEGPEGALAQRLYNGMLDMDARNAAGYAEVIPYVERIRQAETLEQLSALLCDDAFLFTTTFASSEVFADKKDSLHNVVYIDRSPLSLSDADEYRHMTEQGKRMKTANDTYFAWLLEHVGFTAEEARDAVGRMFALETDIAQHCFGVADRARDDYDEITYNVRTADELSASARNYPIMGILQSMGFAESNRLVVEQPEWLDGLGALYREERLEDFKAWMAVRAVSRFAGFMDQETYDRTEQWKNERMGSVGSMPLERNAYETVNALLGMAVGRLYVQRYLAPQTKADVEALIDQVVATYHERLGSATWLSAETRRKACEKLDALTVRVGYPTSWPDYASLDIPDSAGLVELAVSIARFENQRERAKVNQPVDREEWLISPHVVNAYYLPTDNSINILAGILGGVFYSPDASREQNMGGIGMVIGHEITHAFDKSGSLYDKDGNLGNSWWTDQDRTEFKRRTDAVAAYWNDIEVLPGLNVDGDLCVGEIVADLGGMTCMTHIGHTIPGFDFAAMYEAYARDWRMVESQPRAEYLLINDVHAPAHLRTNGTVQMLPEFHEAFGVQPGDGMWLAPEDRHEIW